MFNISKNILKQALDISPVATVIVDLQGRKDGTLDGFLQRWIPRYDLFALEEASRSK